uniref:Uncharacterized protein n=1 Tax=Daucus carota subsp. sativus TaxID=79200 RepID=A0A175YJK2_DAUCS
MDQLDEAYSEEVAVILRAMYAAKRAKENDVPDQIEEGLYLGSIGAANNRSVLKSLNVTHILTVASSLPPSYPNEFKYKIVDELINFWS